jgi:exodeoxyribonuclease VII small subunit
LNGAAVNGCQRRRDITGIQGFYIPNPGPSSTHSRFAGAVDRPVLFIEGSHEILAKQDFKFYNKKSMKFEDGLKKLEDIVKTLDNGNIPLDEALGLFKEGLSLTKELSKRLDEIEKKVEVLIKREDGALDKRPFDEEA